MKYGELPTDDLLARLGLNNTLKIWRHTVDRAVNEGWNHQEFLTVLLVQEVTHRQVTQLHLLAQKAHFPFLKTCNEFDFGRLPGSCKAVVEGCLTPDFVAQGHSLMLAGPRGSGKTHLAVSIAYQALQNGFDALYTTAAEVVDALNEAARHGTWREVVSRYTRPDVLIIDDTGERTEQTNLLFLVLNERYLAHRSNLLATRSPDEWGTASTETKLLVAAIMERVLERGQVLFLEPPASPGQTDRITLDLADDDIEEDSGRTAPPSAPKTEPAQLHGASEADRESGVRERRRHFRHSVDLVVDASSEHNFFTGFCQDLSEGGLFISTHNIRPVGEVIDLTFWLPGGHKVQTSGVVRWQRLSKEEGDESPGIGVQFLALSPVDFEAIKKFFQQREPLFHV